MSVSELGRLSRTVGSSQTCFHAEICLVILNFNLFYIFSPNHVSLYIYIKDFLVHQIVQMYSLQLRVAMALNI